MKIAGNFSCNPANRQMDEKT